MPFKLFIKLLHIGTETWLYMSVILWFIYSESG